MGKLLLSILTVFCAIPAYCISDPDTSVTEKQKILLTNELSAKPGFKELEDDIDSFVKKWQLSGASVAIVKDGRLVYAKGYGYADKEKKLKVTPAHKFRIASISKLVTAVAIMKLVEEGKIGIDDTVFGTKGILNDPQYCKAADKRAYTITVRHLLIHEAGWNSRYGDHMFMPHYISKNMDKPLPVDLETIISFALGKNLHYTPGQANSYSNLGYCILGRIIKKVSGKNYEEYVQQEILNPLGIHGMEITSNFYHKKSPWEVKYYDTPGAKQRLSVYSNNKYAPRTYEGTDFETLGAAGGWIASPAELMKLMVAIDGFCYQEDILGCNTIDSMTTLENPDKYGFGWVHSDGEGNWWRTGTLSGTSAFMMRRSDGISYVFLTNSSTYRGSRFAYDIRDMMQEAIKKITWYPQDDLFEFLPDTEALYTR